MLVWGSLPALISGYLGCCLSTDESLFLSSTLLTNKRLWWVHLKRRYIIHSYNHNTITKMDLYWSSLLFLFCCIDLKSSSSTSSEGRGSHPLCRGSLTDRAPVDALRDQAQLLLTKYIETTYPSQPLRFGRLLLLLPSLASISAATNEDIFFRSTIGDTPIERLIANMYQDEASNGPY